MGLPRASSAPSGQRVLPVQVTGLVWPCIQRWTSPRRNLQCFPTLDAGSWPNRANLYTVDLGTRRNAATSSAVRISPSNATSPSGFCVVGIKLTSFLQVYIGLDEINLELKGACIFNWLAGFYWKFDREMAVVGMHCPWGSPYRTRGRPGTKGPISRPLTAICRRACKGPRTGLSRGSYTSLQCSGESLTDTSFHESPDYAMAPISASLAEACGRIAIGSFRSPAQSAFQRRRGPDALRRNPRGDQGPRPTTPGSTAPAGPSL